MRNDVLDIVQEAFEVLWDKRLSVMEHPNPEGWLYRTAQNKFLSRYSRQKTAQRYNAYSFDEEGRFVVGAMDIELDPAEELRRQQERIIAIIGKEQYDLLLQYYDKEIDHTAIADGMGLTTASLRKKVSRIIHLLRDHEFGLFLVLYAALSHLPE